MTRLLTYADLTEIREVYTLPRLGVEAPDPRLVALVEEHERLRDVLHAARYLVRAVERGEEECVCGRARPADKHGRACPIGRLARMVARAGEP